MVIRICKSKEKEEFPLIYRFWLPLLFFFWLLCSLLWFTDYNYHCCFFFWLLCCLPFDLQILITIVVFSFGYCVVSSIKGENTIAKKKTTMVIRICKSKERQHNSQKKKTSMVIII
jgi:hypothetical protein